LEFDATLSARWFLIQRTMKNGPLQNELREVRELLSRLPDQPVASNFTARVMQAVALEEANAARSRFRNPVWLLRIFAPRAAVAAVALGLAIVIYQRHEFDQRMELAQNVALVAQAQPLPSVEALKNFDAIQRMGQATPHADEELIALGSEMQ
jgi:hypothetical protein